MAENNDIKTKRAQFTERIQGKYPDSDFTDEEVLFGQVSDDYDDYENRLKKYQDDEKVLADMFSADPRSASFLASWHHGEHPMTALVRQFGKEGLEEILSNEEKAEEFAKANEEYLERVADEKKLEEEYQANLPESLRNIEEMQQAEGLSDEDIDAALEMLTNIAHDAIVGKFSPESIRMALKAKYHDDDVEQAATEGEVRGRNARIDAKLRHRQAGDGVPQIDGANNVATPQQKDSIFSLAAGAR